ncbi:MAG: enoyl-CoA hydratase/isomerase family protein [Deltaproteobacteria bacterium]|nr:enoyl-CoA hydratase/isomerase family protein [Deltaproteobacteria bacterium]
MEFVRVARIDGVAVVTLDRGKVNALTVQVVDEVAAAFRDLATDDGVAAAVLTGSGKFFSFGFDIPEFLGFSKEAFIDYLTKFTGLYRQLFVWPKALVAALNGHTVAGGCMLALACDRRLMVPGNAKISLNEITFGASVFFGAVEMLKLAVGARRAETVLFGGAMYLAEEAAAIGLVDEVVPADRLGEEARAAARGLGEHEPAAFASIKRLLRAPTAQAMLARERDSILEFADIWYSPATRARLKEITIR